jgi:hypothetical protein
MSLGRLPVLTPTPLWYRWPTEAPPSYELKVLNLLDGKETGELVKLDKR